MVMPVMVYVYTQIRLVEYGIDVLTLILISWLLIGLCL